MRSDWCQQIEKESGRTTNMKLKCCRIQNTGPLPEGQAFRVGQPTTMIFVHEDEFETARECETIHSY